MNPPRCTRQSLTTILAAAILCAAAGAAAQDVHKLVDATGQVTFSDRPDETGALQAAPEAETPRRPKRIAGISSPRAAALVDTKEAARRLQQAQLSHRQGMEPMPGEQAAGVPNSRYWRRQEKLRLLVEQAQRRANETSRPQVAAR